MEGKDFLEVAARLSKSEQEADRRTAISRSYYAVFNHAKSLLESAGINLPRDATLHDAIYRYLHNSGIEEAEDIAQDLSGMRAIRNDADYDMKAIGFDSNNCVLWYMKAKLCVGALDSLNKQGLKSGIAEYMKAID